jgi:hypothetical protein
VPSLTSTVTEPGVASETSRSSRADCSLPASRAVKVRSVQRHLQLGLIDHAGKLDLEVEFRADEDIRSIDRIDGLGKCRRGRQQ